MAARSIEPVKFSTHKSLAHRLVLSTLTGRPILISKIRDSNVAAYGLASHEMSFLKLLEVITNGSQITIDMGGNKVLYRPGLITGSAPGLGSSSGALQFNLESDCTRGLSYFLIPLCLLAPFSKSPVNISFKGEGVITSATSTGDVSVDTVRTSILPIYEKFGISNNIELRILKRSSTGRTGKGGAGEVQLVFGHQVRRPKTVHLLSPGRVKKIRGIAYCIGVPGSNNARMIEAARGVLNAFCPDTYAFTDVVSAPFLPGSQTQRTGVGFGLSLVAESSTGSLYSADVASPPEGGEAAEDIGLKCAHQLLEVISQGGCISRTTAPTFLTLMAMGSEDAGRVRLGRQVIGSEELIGLARDLVVLGGNGWGLRDATDDPEGDIVVSVVGRGVGNVGRKVA
ncbi:MAG: hypothetical protein M1814_003356 [Vezdaea aestivalis]|nr:MAG: hypothetical protein M1814_003356 [Vezdaea aestivalis]